MQRKPGGYRTPSPPQRLLSVIPAADHRRWFQQIWTGLPGASTRDHPAPYPLELVQRLVRMFSFVGDTVLDPLVGTGTTSVAATRWGRHSHGIELDPSYFEQARRRLCSEASVVSGLATIAMKNEQVHVLRAVAAALGNIGKPAATPALPLLRELSKIPRVRWSAEWAIRKVE